MSVSKPKTSLLAKVLKQNLYRANGPLTNALGKPQISENCGEGPSIIEFKGQWYFFYHDGAYTLNGNPGGDCRRQVCVEYLYFNPDGSIKPITLTTEGVSVK